MQYKIHREKVCRILENGLTTAHDYLDSCVYDFILITNCDQTVVSASRQLADEFSHHYVSLPVPHPGLQLSKCRIVSTLDLEAVGISCAASSTVSSDQFLRSLKTLDLS